MNFVGKKGFMQNLKSPISCIGSKHYLTSWLKSFIPKHDRYTEPFSGGAALLFEKERSKIEIINDTNSDLVNLYQCIQNPDKRTKLVQILNETPYSRSIFKQWKYGNESPQDDVDRAARYFFLCKSSFAGDVVHGGFACPSKNTTRNPAMTYQNSIDALNHIAERLKGVTIECLNYVDCIQKYDSPGTLFYIDPPYYGHEDYYGDSFTEQDHYRLIGILHSVKAKVMLSHYECDTYDQLYRGWNKYMFESFKGSHKADINETKPATNECLYTNFQESCKQKFLFQG